MLLHWVTELTHWLTHLKKRKRRISERCNAGTFERKSSIKQINRPIWLSNVKPIHYNVMSKFRTRKFVCFLNPLHTYVQTANRWIPRSSTQPKLHLTHPPGLSASNSYSSSPPPPPLLLQWFSVELVSQLNIRRKGRRSSISIFDLGLICNEFNAYEKGMNAS